MRTLIALSGFLLLTTTTDAQTRRWVGTGVGVGVGVGPGFGPGFAAPGWGYYGLPYGPFAFGYPGAAGSFWTNGQSLYGPPVPTYGPTPGSFGGSDSGRLYHATPPGGALALGYGLGWHGSRSPSPRGWPTVDVYPTGRGELTGASRDIRAPREAIPTSSTCLRLCVKVPDENASVWVEGVAISGTGTERWVESPPLTSGQEFKYTVTAKWSGDKIETKTVTGKAGDTLELAFANATASQIVR